MNSFKIRFGDLQAHSCYNRKRDRAEIVKWENDDNICLTLAIFDSIPDGTFELRFVSDRPFIHTTVYEFFFFAQMTLHLYNSILKEEIPS